MFRRFWRRLRRILHLSPSLGFLNLPNEIIYLVAEYLTVPELNSLLCTNHLLKSLITPFMTRRAATTLLPMRYSRYPRNVVHWAVSHNRTCLLQSFLAQGGQILINRQSIGLTTPLQSGVMLGHVKAVRILLENGADPEILNRADWTALMTAVIADNYSMCALLLDYGAEVNARGENFGRINAIHYAAGLGRSSILKLLVERGADTASVNSFGANLIETALVCRREAMAELLVGLISKNIGGSCEGEYGSLRWAIERVHSSLQYMVSDEQFDLWLHSR